MQIPLLRHLEFTICYYAASSLRSNAHEFCTVNSRFRIISYVVSFLPYYWRTLQVLHPPIETLICPDCNNITIIFLERLYLRSSVLKCIRRYLEEGYYPEQLGNAGKYISTMIAAAARIKYAMTPTPFWLAAVIVSSAVATLYQLYWDFVKDWGFFSSSSKNAFLRNDLVLGLKSIYYVSIVSALFCETLIQPFISQTTALALSSVTIKESKSQSSIKWSYDGDARATWTKSLRPFFFFLPINRCSMKCLSVYAVYENTIECVLVFNRVVSLFPILSV